MTNQIPWQISSPGCENIKTSNFASTTHNTTANSKQTQKTPEDYSDVKTFSYNLESPCLNRPFNEHDNH